MKVSWIPREEAGLPAELCEKSRTAYERYYGKMLRLG